MYFFVVHIANTISLLTQLTTRHFFYIRFKIHIKNYRIFEHCRDIGLFIFYFVHVGVLQITQIFRLVKTLRMLTHSFCVFLFG